jgi:hypothetical protein
MIHGANELAWALLSGSALALTPGSATVTGRRGGSLSLLEKLFLFPALAMLYRRRFRRRWRSRGGLLRRLLRLLLGLRLRLGLTSSLLR